ncbi:MAG: DUF11 domain-containing protein, partial [Thermoplasmatales archaeon]|nr:DUF11 domain-containing protein [Thermoplasmatales archaeon]
YVLSDHHAKQFDAWGINPDGTATFQAPITLMYASAPGDIAIDESSNVLFITSEGTSSPFPMVEIVNATSMSSLGYVMGPAGAGTDMAGIEADDEKNIVYVMKRGSYTAGSLYALDWDESTSSLTLRAGYPVTVTGGGLGIALDETTGILWVCDGDAPGTARAYNTTTWVEDTSLSFNPSHQPVDVAVDRMRGIVYTVSMNADGGAWVPFGAGSYNLSKYDLATSTETTLDVGHELVGIGVDETTGYVYATSGTSGSSGTKSLEIWDTSTSPWTQLQLTGLPGSPCGVCIPQAEVSYNPLNLEKDDRLEVCVSPGDEINYSICFDNMNDFSVNNVILEDTLPSEVIFVDASHGGSYDSVNHKVVWDVGTISIEEGGCEWLLVQVDSLTPPETTITNYVTIDSDETPQTTVSEETLVCEDSGEDYPPIQTIELGTPLMEDIYYTGLEWLDLIGSQTPVWINSSDAETGTDFIKYKLFKSDVFGSWDDPAWVYVYDNQQTGDPFTTDTDPNNSRISIQFYIEESCFHQIHAHCVDTMGNWNYLPPYDFLVDFDAPSNDDFTYIDDYLLPGGARYINNQTIKRIFANDTGCTGGVAGVGRIIWRIENNKTQIIAEGIIYDNNDTGYEDDNVSVSGDLDDTEGKMIIDIQLNEECMHFIYHQAIDKLENKVVGRKQLVYVDLTPPTIFKTVGDPNCTIVTGEEYCISPDTPITFYAEDRGCMGGVGLDTVEYNIWYQGDWTGWMLLEELEDEPLYLTEECMHYLLIRATDILGNEIEDNETFYVDITAPIIEKTVGDPNCTGYGEMGDDDYCVTTDTNITLDAFDLGCCPSGDFTIEYR